MHNQISRVVVLTSREVGIQNLLRAGGVALLGVDGGSGHVRGHGVTASPWVLGVTERVVLGCWLREPDITTVTTELAGLDGFSDVFLDDDGTTSGVNEPCTWRSDPLVLVHRNSVVGAQTYHPSSWRSTPC